MTLCLDCGREFVQSGQGRPRQFCETCRPRKSPGAVTRPPDEPDWVSELRDRLR